MKQRNYDPEALISGTEEAAGMTFANSRRYWPDNATYLKAVAGDLTPLEILQIAPRELLSAASVGQRRFDATY